MNEFLKFSAQKISSSISHLSYLATILMITCFPFSFAIFNIGMVIIMISFVLQKIFQFKKKESLIFDPWIDSALALYFTAAIFSLFFSQYLWMSFDGVQKLFRYLLLFMAAREIFKKSGDVSQVAYFLMMGAMIAAGDALIQYTTGRDLIFRRTPMLSMNELIRVTGPFLNANTLAIYLVYFIPLVYLRVKFSKNINEKLGMSALIFILLIALGLTYSRPAAMALSVSLLILMTLKKDWFLIIVFVVSALAAIFLAPADIHQWISSLSSPGKFLYDKSRYFHHQAAWHMIAHSPWWGVGINTFDVNYHAFRLPEDTIERWSAHQAYLQIWAETGLAGLVNFLMLLMGIIRYAWKGYQKTKDALLRNMILGFLMGTFSFLFIGFFESNFWQPRQTCFFWFWAGLMCSLASLSKKTEPLTRE